MAISQYSELVTAVQNHLERSSESSARIAEWVAITQSYMHYGDGAGMNRMEPLRISAMETAADLSITSGTASLPTGHLETRRIYLDTDPKRFLKLVSPEKLYSTWASSITGEPLAFCVENGSYVFAPAPDGTYTGKCLYYKTFDALSLDADTDWVLTNAPQVYLWGTLSEAYDYHQDQANADRMRARFWAAIQSLNTDDDRKRNSGAVWVMSADHGHP